MIYLCLYHGRKSSLDRMDDWGEIGPAIGPLDAVRCTYGSTVEIAGDDTSALLPLIEGCVPFDGVLFGDFAVSMDPKSHEIVPFEDAIRRIRLDEAPGGFVERCRVGVLVPPVTEPPPGFPPLGECGSCYSGWYHMGDPEDENAEVSRCDECAEYDTDEDALEAHNRQCPKGAACEFARVLERDEEGDDDAA